MKVYQQQMLMISGAWEQIGWEDGLPINFPSREEAELGLEEFFAGMEEAVATGYIDDFFRRDYRVEEVEV